MGRNPITVLQKADDRLNTIIRFLFLTDLSGDVHILLPVINNKNRFQHQIESDHNK